MDVGEFRVFRDGRRLVDRAAEIARSGAPALAVGGGDGTIGAVAGQMAGTGCALGLIPAGTGNAFARDLGMDGSLEQAADWIAAGGARGVDVALVGEMPCVNVATLGLSTLVARYLDPALKRYLGKPAYALAVVRAVRSVEPMHVRIVAGNAAVETPTLQVVVANGRTHGGPFVVAPNAKLDSGLLSVYAVQTGDKRALVRYALSMAFRGGHVMLPEVWSVETPTVRVESEPASRCTVDGEAGPKTPFEARSLPGALRVLAPQ